MSAASAASDHASGGGSDVDSYGNLPSFDGRDKLGRGVSGSSDGSAEPFGSDGFVRGLSCPLSCSNEKVKAPSKLHEFRSKHAKIIQMLREVSVETLGDANPDSPQPPLAVGDRRVRLRGHSEEGALLRLVQEASKGQAQLLQRVEEEHAAATTRGLGGLAHLHADSLIHLGELRGAAGRQAADLQALHAAAGELELGVRSVQGLADASDRLGAARAQAAAAALQQLIEGLGDPDRALAAARRQQEEAIEHVAAMREGLEVQLKRTGHLTLRVQDLRADVASAHAGVEACRGHVAAASEQAAARHRLTSGALRSLRDGLQGEAELEALQSELQKYSRSDLAYQSTAKSWAAEREQLHDEIDRLRLVLAQRYVAAVTGGAPAAIMEGALAQAAPPQPAVVVLASPSKAGKHLWGSHPSAHHHRTLKLAAVIAGLALALEGAAMFGVRPGSGRFGFDTVRPEQPPPGPLARRPAFLWPHLGSSHGRP